MGQRQRAVLQKRLKVPPMVNQFSQCLDKQTAAAFFKLALKYKPESRAEKKARLTARAEAKAAGGADEPDQKEEGPAGRHRPRRRPHRDRPLPPNLVPPHGDPLLHRQGQEPIGSSRRPQELLVRRPHQRQRRGPCRSWQTCRVRQHELQRARRRDPSQLGWSNHVATFPGCRRQARAHPTQGARQEAGLSASSSCALPVTPLFSLFPLKMENPKKKKKKKKKKS